MTDSPVNIVTIDCTRCDAAGSIAYLREKLSPRGNVVSEAGRQRTIDLFGEPLSPQQVVERICGDVSREGLSAVLDYTRRLDGRQLTAKTMRVSPEELATAHRRADHGYLETIRRIAGHIAEFQRSILPDDVRLSRRAGEGTVDLQLRYLPMQRVGLCVPGGAAAYPSTLLMTAVPAQTAGVREIVVVVPPTEFGGYNPDLLAACHEVGITEVYRIGGAQAVAALAYGIDGIERVDKIVGPGNLFVALAKRHVFGEVDIDSVAGPSEVIVLADETARPDFVAADLISQAEHSPGSGVLMTWCSSLIEPVLAELGRQLAPLPRGDLARQSLENYGALILTRDEEEAVRLTNLFAPEHLHISTAVPQKLLDRIPNAGAIFLGHFTPVAVGDYIAGPSHVLPTGGTARFANGLCSIDFLKRSSVISYDREALAAETDDIIRMASTERLTAHGESVSLRLGHPAD